jgi:hypothetical protein
MTDRDEIIRMAREACGEDQDPFVSGWVTMHHNELARFAALFAAAEREACAKVCEEFEDATDRLNRPSGYECAAAIRARGEK